MSQFGNYFWTLTAKVATSWADSSIAFTVLTVTVDFLSVFLTYSSPLISKRKVTIWTRLIQKKHHQQKSDINLNARWHLDILRYFSSHIQSTIANYQLKLKASNQQRFSRATVLSGVFSSVFHKNTPIWQCLAGNQ